MRQFEVDSVRACIRFKFISAESYKLSFELAKSSFLCDSKRSQVFFYILIWPMYISTDRAGYIKNENIPIKFHLFPFRFILFVWFYFIFVLPSNISKIYRTIASNNTNNAWEIYCLNADRAFLFASHVKM